MLSLYFVMTTCSLLVHHFFIFSNKSINLKRQKTFLILKYFFFLPTKKSLHLQLSDLQLYFFDRDTAKNQK